MFDVSAAYEGSHGMSGNDQVEEPEPGRETSESWPSSTVTVHMARGAELARRRDREVSPK